MRSSPRLLTALLFTSTSFSLMAQDMIFKTDGDTIFGKVVEISESEVKFRRRNLPESPYYIIRSAKVDSIVYASGETDEIARLFYLRKEGTHLKTKNTYSFDPLGFANYSITQWYEHRVWNNRIGIRIPLYLCFMQNYSPGFGIIRNDKRHIRLDDGFAFAMGINPKFYFNKHKVVRLFAGPEADGGYTAYPKHRMSLYYPMDYGYHRTGNVQLAAMAGININPVAGFNITLEGGAGYTFAFARNFYAGNPIWRAGLSLGGNF